MYVNLSVRARRDLFFVCESSNEILVAIDQKVSPPPPTTPEKKRKKFTKLKKSDNSTIAFLVLFIFYSFEAFLYLGLRYYY